ncbi:putative cytoplasmic protein [Salmonella enterica]|nr:putative cytoplasmic protein [Salmonella enterica]
MLSLHSVALEKSFSKLTQLKNSTLFSMTTEKLLLVSGVKASLTKKTYIIQRRVASSDRNVSEGRKPSSVLKVKVGNVFDFPNIDETRQVTRQLVQTMLATKRNPNKIKRETDASELETVIKIVLHEGKPIHFATTVIALSSDRYLELCDLYSSQAIE